MDKKYTPLAPAQHGYFVLRVNEDEGLVVADFRTPVIAWVLDEKNRPHPVTPQEVETCDGEGTSILAPDGSVYEMNWHGEEGDLGDWWPGFDSWLKSQQIRVAGAYANYLTEKAMRAKKAAKP
ncbi:MAG: hypothetical protein Q8N02_02180 [Methylotenera sp.]|nr:hypothetical protein [Methylotenera sp.]MDP2404584.1 hypothetical protein [Methylotenera sp.]MDP3094372.1 hypothetical protein [Methylotenera sp.]MDZ4222196.1 hypothetical protein [Methylotenera sp.]